MKNVLVVGCFGGIGLATTKSLIQQGYNVIGLDLIEKEKIDGFTFYSINLKYENTIISAYKEISKTIDSLYAIVNVSGIYLMDSLLEISDESLKNLFEINFFGVTKINRIFFPLLTKGSRILITTSEVANLDPLPFNGIYAMSKSLLENYAASLRMELNLFGIKVITLRPGAIKTTLLNDSMTSLNNFVSNTKIHKSSGTEFIKIVNSIESKTIEPVKIGKFISKILSRKNPKYHYKINNNVLLKLLSILPQRLQVKIISKLLKGKK